MAALNILLTTDYGLLSLGSILFMIGMAAYLTRYVITHMRAEEQQAK